MMTPRSVAVASSPGREKLPAPPGLARLLIRKTRSRSVARASPMFGVRSRSVGPTGRSNDTQGEEPSSPKVTCIGQVRIRTGAKGKKKKKKKRAKSKPVKCRCLNRALFCGVVSEGKKKKKKKKKSDEKITRSLWPCWGRGCCTMKGDHESSKINEVQIHEADRVTGQPLMARNSNFSDEPGRFSNFNDEPGRYSNFSDEPARTSNYGRRSFVGRGEISDREEDEKEGEIKEKDEEPLEEKELVSSATTTPPKNALFLMRCRSAPQHHNRFAPSPNITIEESTEVKLKTTDENRGLETTEENEMQEIRVETEKLNQEKEETEEEEEEEEEDEEEEEEEMRCSSARPLVLTRCKSEPASKGEKIIGLAGPEMASTSCFWAHTGSGSRQKKMGAINGLEQRTPSPLPTH